jgi:toxin ParE1/3/4
MRHHIRLTAQAKQDLRDIWRGLAEFSGLSQADDRLKDIKQKFNQLAQFPNSGRDRSELLPDLRSLPVNGFVIFYRIAPNHIAIVRVINGRRDIEALFNQDEN